LEIRGGQHILYRLCKICNAPNNRVTVFTTRAIFSAVKDVLGEELREYDFVLKEESESNGSFLKRVEKICSDKIDLLSVNKIRGRNFFDFWQFNPSCKKMLWIYTVNFWLKSRPVFDKNLLLTAAWNFKSLMKRPILSNYDAICVEYSPMKDYILENTDWEKKVYSLPLSLFEETPSPRDNGPIRFSILGSILKRRNHELVLEVFEELFSKYGNKIELHVLGKPSPDYGYKIIEYCRNLEERGYQIHYYRERKWVPQETKWIPQKEYHELLNKSDVLISPLKGTLEKSKGGIGETIGLTTGTGTIHDSLTHGKPIILPKTFKTGSEIKANILKYEDREALRGMLEELIEDEEKLKKLQKKALENSKRFSLENQQARFEDIANDLLGER